MKNFDDVLTKRVKKVYEDYGDERLSVETIMYVLTQNFKEYKNKPVKVFKDSVLASFRFIKLNNSGKQEDSSQYLAHLSRKTSVHKEKPPSKESEPSAIPSQRLSDVAGLDATIEDLCKVLIHIRHPEIFTHIGIQPPTGLLLHGPPGTGKTFLAKCLAGEMGLQLLRVSGPEIISGISGESEQRIRELFNKAKKMAPCVLFFDEIDAITSKRESASKEMEKRVVSQLITCMDEIASTEENKSQVLVLGATNRPELIDSALRRAGRFDREIRLGIPNPIQREAILRCVCSKLKTSEDFSWTELSELTPGFVGADFVALSREAALHAIDSVLKSKTNQKTPFQSLLQNEDCLNLNLENVHVTINDFKAVLRHVVPSAKREGFASVPSVSWDNVGGLGWVRKELRAAMLGAVRHSDLYASLGLEATGGILLTGPPGCGKTLVARAVASEAGISFISVKGPELLNMYVGESERAVRRCFERARNSAPCVIFFDELDALCPKRTVGEGESSARVVNQLLTELDGIESRRGVFVLGATNRPDTLDPAVLRPGRFERTLKIGLPSLEARADILRALTTSLNLNNGQSLLSEFAAKSEHFSGADLSALVKEATLLALTEVFDTNDSKPSSSTTIAKVELSHHHFQKALSRIKPSAYYKS